LDFLGHCLLVINRHGNGSIWAENLNALDEQPLSDRRFTYLTGYPGICAEKGANVLNVNVLRIKRGKRLEASWGGDQAIANYFQ